jgi:hypothetical protein
MDFTGIFLAKGRLPGSVGVSVDGGVALRPYNKELSPDRDVLFVIIQRTNGTETIGL